MEAWHRTMQAPKATVDRALLATRMLPAEQVAHPFAPAAPLPPDTAFQVGGEHAGQHWLRSWVEGRITRYAASISKPEASRSGCSRLSPYLAWGCVSARQVYQAQHQAALRATEGRNFRAFTDRLRWRDHFIQKFEMEDRMEHAHLHRAFEHYPWTDDDAAYQRWATGTTGYPMVDACMRSLIATGYLNFRMRAMLVSFATQILGLHWKRPALHLARQFLDFEPGIHYPQIQMQAGTTAVHTLRLYDPVKQGLDHDPEGRFIRQWVPELRAVRGPLVHMPWAMTALERMAWPLDYPDPLVPYPTAWAEARDRVYAFRKGLAFDAEARRIVQRHTIPGSRRT
jgi:deoxyribodipyrimidine photo-lyase